METYVEVAELDDVAHAIGSWTRLGRVAIDENVDKRLEMSVIFFVVEGRVNHLEFGDVIDRIVGLVGTSDIKNDSDCRLFRRRIVNDVTQGLTQSLYFLVSDKPTVGVGVFFPFDFAFCFATLISSKIN
jgi:hypothetical protein